MIPKTETPKSSNMLYFSYEPGVLTVAFKSGTYEIRGRLDDEGKPDPGGFPEDDAQRLLTAHSQDGSVGSHFYHHIRGKFDTKRIG